MPFSVVKDKCLALLLGGLVFNFAARRHRLFLVLSGYKNQKNIVILPHPDNNF